MSSSGNKERMESGNYMNKSSDTAKSNNEGNSALKNIRDLTNGYSIEEMIEAIIKQIQIQNKSDKEFIPEVNEIVELLSQTVKAIPNDLTIQQLQNVNIGESDCIEGSSLGKESCREECCCPPKDNKNCCDDDRNIIFNKCEDIKDITIDDVGIKHQGRFLIVSVKLKKVWINREIVVGVIVSEKIGDKSYVRGYRILPIVVNSRKKDDCTEDVKVGDFCFVFPEEHDICHKRSFNVKIIVHYASCIPSHLIGY